jgi:hypothetical protein
VSVATVIASGIASVHVRAPTIRDLLEPIIHLLVARSRIDGRPFLLMQERAHVESALAVLPYLAEGQKVMVLVFLQCSHHAASHIRDVVGA